MYFDFFSDEFHSRIISLFDMGGGGGLMCIWRAIMFLYFTLDIWEFYSR